MNISQKTNYISALVLLVCLLIALIIYLYTGNVIIAIFFAPPIVHWILKRKEKENR